MVNEMMLKIANAYMEAAPDFGAVSVSDRRHVSYFENEGGEQLVFTRSLDEDGNPAPTATVHVGDRRWAAIEIDDGTEVEELRLSGVERSWLATCWEASFGGADVEARARATARALARNNWSDAYLKWPTSRAHQSFMAAFGGVCAWRAGQRGWDPGIVMIMLEAGEVELDKIAKERGQ